MSATPIRGLLFDKDGTLFDFAASWSGVIDATLAALSADTDVQHRMARASGYDPETKEFEAGSPSVAGTLDEVAAIWARHLPDGRPERVIAVAAQIEAGSSGNGNLVPAVRNLAGFLGGLKQRGYMLGIATHDSEAAARAHMAAHNSISHFDFVAG
ncbi:MAG: HAD family hydrolase [Paracoccaceae bacterium]